MQQLINNITLLIFLVMLLIIIIVAAIFFAMIKLRNKNGKQKESANLLEVKRLNAQSLLPIEDIRDDMIIEKGGNRFCAVITCQGTDFYTTNRDEKISVQNNYIDFIFALEEPITFRQYDEGINVDYTLEKLRKAYSSLESQIFNLGEDYKENHKIYMSLKATNDPGLPGLVAYLQNLKTRSDCLHWRINHVQSQIQYLERITGGETGKQKQKLTYVVSWEPDTRSLIGLPGQSIHETARTELDRLCRVKIRQLTDAGAIARRCTTKELVEICRRHSCPISADRYPIDQVYQSTYFDDITTTDMTDRHNEEFEDDVIRQLLYGGGK